MSATPIRTIRCVYRPAPSLRVPPISERGSVSEIIRLFGGADQLRGAVHEMQRLLYAA